MVAMQGSDVENATQYGRKVTTEILGREGGEEADFFSLLLASGLIVAK